MPRFSFKEVTPYGIRFSVNSGSDSWEVAVLNETLVPLSGDSPETKYEKNLERLAGIALAKIALGETFEGQMIISFADLHRPDLPY